MTLDSGLSQRFAKHVVRRMPAQVVTDTQTLQRRATREKDNIELDPIVVICVVGGLLGLFVLFLVIGGICKLANRPRSEARHNVYSKAMFQPSAAGYGVRGGPKEGTLDLSSSNLLGSASPMGQGGRYSDPDTLAGGSSDSAHGTRTHVRGKSSGVNFPGTPAAFRRGGGGQQHPQVGQPMPTLDGPVASPSFSDAAPDGSGFRPGQVFDYGALNGGAPRHPNGYAPRQGSLRPINRGPPPALGRSKSGRYAQGADAARRSRIDSLGPGQIRRSMYLPEEGDRKSIFLTQDSQVAFLQLSDPIQCTPSNPERTEGGLRRVDSVGKGDPRRKSNYGGGRAPSAYGKVLDVGANDLLSAKADNWGSGRRSPSLRSPTTAGPLGPLGPSGAPASRAPGLSYSGGEESHGPMQSRGYGGMAGYGTNGGGGM